MEQGQVEDSDANTNMINLSRSKFKKGLIRHMKEQEIATEVEEVDVQEEGDDVNRIKPSRSKGQEGGMAGQVTVQAVATEGSSKKRKVEEHGVEKSLVPPLGRKLVEHVAKESDEIIFLGFKRREGMPMAVTVGDVLHQRENPLPFAWRCHLDKVEGSEASQSLRKDEKGLKKRKEVLSKLESDMPEENKETEKRKGFDPFVDVYFDCAVVDCQDCKELELL